MGHETELPKELMRRYLNRLESGDFEQAVEQFTEDVTYYHPLLEKPIEGREALLHFFSETRESTDGSDGMDHVLEEWIIDGDEFIVKGSMEGTIGGTQFVAYGELTDGKISNYTPGLLDHIW